MTQLMLWMDVLRKIVRRRPKAAVALHGSGFDEDGEWISMLQHQVQILG